MYAQKYVENDVNNKSPVELVRLLYSKAIERLHRAVALEQGGDLRQRNEQISRVMEILVELQGSLNFEAGADIATSLARLYEYMQHRLVEAIAAKQAAPTIEEVLRPLGVLYDAWKDCEPGSDVAPDHAPARLSAPEADPPQQQPQDQEPLASGYVHPEPGGNQGGRVWTF